MRVSASEIVGPHEAQARDITSIDSRERAVVLLAERAPIGRPIMTGAIIQEAIREVGRRGTRGGEDQPHGRSTLEHPTVHCPSVSPDPKPPYCRRWRGSPSRMMVLVSRKLSRPSVPPSRPIPDCLKPPKAMVASARTPFCPTVPERNSRAIL